MSAQNASESLQGLKHALSRLQFEAGTERQGERAVEQLKEVSKRYDFFRAILLEKMEPGEITFDRYDLAARSVQAAVIENLGKVSRILEQWKLARAEEGKPALLQEAEGLLGLNDAALERLDSVTTSIREVRTGKSGGSEDLATLIGELEELAGRAKKYST